jgi:hypothetical protein
MSVSQKHPYHLVLGLGMILYTMFVWWRDVIRESTYEGHHTLWSN